MLAFSVGLTMAAGVLLPRTGCPKERRGPHTQPAITATAPTDAQAKRQAVYGRLPLCFEANQGRNDARLHFLSYGHDSTLFLTSTEAVLAIRQGTGGSPCSYRPTYTIRRRQSLAANRRAGGTARQEPLLPANIRSNGAPTFPPTAKFTVTKSILGWMSSSLPRRSSLASMSTSATLLWSILHNISPEHVLRPLRLLEGKSCAKNRCSELSCSP